MTLPPASLRHAFDSAARHLLGRIAATYFESRTLSTLRDTLLPKLISGELRVKDPEKILARAS